MGRWDDCSISKNPNPNPKPNPIFYEDKLEHYGLNVTPDKNRSRKVETKN